MRVCLASTSPARLALLRQSGIEPICLSPDVDEDAVAAAEAEALGRPLAPEEVVLLLGRAKAAEVAARIHDVHPRFEGIVIGEPQRAFYGSQFALTFPILVHYGVALFVPEVGGQVLRRRGFCRPDETVGQQAGGVTIRQSAGQKLVRQNVADSISHNSGSSQVLTHTPSWRSRVAMAAVRLPWPTV